MSGNREQVFPTRMTLGLMKTKLKGANQGYSLLKRKSEALTKRFRDITKRIDDAKQKMGRVMQTAAFPWPKFPMQQVKTLAIKCKKVSLLQDSK